MSLLTQHMSCPSKESAFEIRGRYDILRMISHITRTATPHSDAIGIRSSRTEMRKVVSFKAVHVRPILCGAGICLNSTALVAARFCLSKNRSKKKNKCNMIQRWQNGPTSKEVKAVNSFDGARLMPHGIKVGCSTALNSCFALASQTLVVLLKRWHILHWRETLWRTRLRGETMCLSLQL